MYSWQTMASYINRPYIAPAIAPLRTPIHKYVRGGKCEPRHSPGVRCPSKVATLGLCVSRTCITDVPEIKAFQFIYLLSRLARTKIVREVGSKAATYATRSSGGSACELHRLSAMLRTHSDLVKDSLATPLLGRVPAKYVDADQPRPLRRVARSGFLTVADAELQRLRISKTLNVLNDRSDAVIRHFKAADGCLLTIVLLHRRILATG